MSIIQIKEEQAFLRTHPRRKDLLQLMNTIINKENSEKQIEDAMVKLDIEFTLIEEERRAHLEKTLGRRVSDQEYKFYKLREIYLKSAPARI